MKIENYPRYKNESTLYIHAGVFVDLDLQGGLEELMLKEIENGTKRIVLDLKGMRFLHATLTAGLLNTEIHLKRNEGELVIVSAPEFVKRMMEKWEVVKEEAPSEETVI